MHLFVCVCVVLMYSLSAIHNRLTTRHVTLVKSSGNLIILIKIELKFRIDFSRYEITLETFSNLFPSSIQVI